MQVWLKGLGVGNVDFVEWGKNWIYYLILSGNGFEVKGVYRDQLALGIVDLSEGEVADLLALVPTLFGRDINLRLGTYRPGVICQSCVSSNP